MKTRKDVSDLFKTILTTTSNQLDIHNNTEHREMISGFVDYLGKFGFDLAYEVLYEYLYVTPTTFFDWSKVVGILRDKVKATYPTPEAAYLKLKKQMGAYNPVDSEPPMDELTTQAVTELGGYYSTCKSTTLERDFQTLYSKILEKKVTERMKNG
jgi:hypothetical protein